MPAEGAASESSEDTASAAPAPEPAPVPPTAAETESQAADPVPPYDLSQNRAAAGAPETSVPSEHPETAERAEAYPSQFSAPEAEPAPRNAAPSFAQPEAGYSMPPEAPQAAAQDNSQEYVIPPGGSSAVPYADYESGVEYAEPQELGPREDGYDDVDMSYINEEHDAAEFLYQSSRDESAPAEEERTEGGSGFTGELAEADLIGEIDDDWCSDLAKSRISGIDLYVLMSGLRTESSGLWTVTLPFAMQDAAGEDYIVLDCDPWTQSQDDVEFTCSVKSVDAVTDSTATVTLATENFGYAGQLALQLVYESGDWFVDDFGGNLREYLQSFIDGE